MFLKYLDFYKWQGTFLTSLYTLPENPKIWHGVSAQTIADKESTKLSGAPEWCSITHLNAICVISHHKL